VPVAVGIFVLSQRRRMRYAVRFTNVDVLALVARERTWRRVVPVALFLLALATACTALARPRAHTSVTNERATVILVIDTSRSMQSMDVRPSRLAAAEEAARIFIERVPKRLRLGLIAFAGDVQVVAVPTRDHRLVLQQLDSIGSVSAFGGTAIGDALARAVEVGRRALSEDSGLAADAPPKGLVSILFLSDGRQNRGILPPLEGAARAKAAGFPVYAVALGSGDSDPLSVLGTFGGNRAPDPETLRAIAKATGGEFTAARTAGALKAAYAKLGSKLGRMPGTVEVTRWFLLGAAGLLAAAWVMGARRAPRLP
jgi:Ca-activated chloride channel homolog